MFLKVELFLWIQLLGASSHDSTISGDRVSHVEVVNVVCEHSLVYLLLQVRITLQAK
jgi:hypothetical protein